MPPYDPAHQRLVHRAAAAVRAAHLDAHHVPALRGRDHDRRVAGGGALRVAGRVHAGHVRDQMGQRLRQPYRVHLHLDRRGVHRELRAPGPDQLDRALDAGRHHLVQRHRLARETGGARVQPLVAQHVVHERGHTRVAGGQVVQRLVRLRPQLPGRIGRQPAQFAAELLQRPAQPALQHGQELFVACGEGVVGGAVGEGEHRADELVAVAHRRGRHVDRHRAPALGPQHLPAHPVLAPGAQAVGERRLLPRELAAVGARVVDERVELLPAQLARPVAEDLRGGRVDQDDPALGVHTHHALGGGTQDHLGLALLPGQLGLGVDGAGQVADDEHQQLVAGVAVAVVGEGGLEGRLVGGAPVLQVGAGHLDHELRSVGAPRHHPRRLGAGLGGVVGAAHRAGDELGVEVREQVEQSAPDQGRARRLEDLQGDAVGVDDRAVAVHEKQRVRQCVEYGCEASSASGWPAAHDDASSLLTSWCTVAAPEPGRGPAPGGPERG